VSTSVTVPAPLVAVPFGEAAAAVRRAGRDNPLLGIDIGIDIGVDTGGDAGIPTGRLQPAVVGATGARIAAAELVDAVGAWLGSAERRVAASMVLVGYSTRLVGPSVAVLLRFGILLDLRPSQVRYSYVPERGFRLAVPQPAGWRGPPAALQRRWCRDVVDEHLGSVVAAVRSVVPVAAGLLWGNVASGLAGALRTLAAGGAVPLAHCHDAGLSMLECGPLRNAGRLWVDGGQLCFMRRSCCLFYRLDGGGTCGDCPLPARAGAA
jgi:ferric iron reductase protein FhuF